MAYQAVLALLLTHACVFSSSEPVSCGTRALIDSGWVCGARRWAPNGTEFAAFLGVPYAKQPLGELRFQELQPVEPWDVLDATKEGPVCPQRDVFYGRIMQPRDMSEACIHANVYVPIHALPQLRSERPARELKPPYQTGVGNDDDLIKGGPGLPIFVFIHGGGFAFGSGDPDLYGPEHLIKQDVIVITFNYRLNVFGFLSLNNSFIPGNNGLRDMVMLLRWVQTNAHSFGGNPHDVTLAGHSAGASSAHLLSLSDAAQGLFKRVMLMSGTALPTFFTTAPAYAQFASTMFLKELAISSTDAEDVHRQLVEMPLDKIMAAHNKMQDLFGLAVFYPVVESYFPNFTTILDDDPKALLARGKGKDIPLMIGFTDAECYGFLPRFKEINILTTVKANPIILAPMHLIYRRPPAVSLEIAKRVQARYFHNESTIDQYVKSCSEANFIYPAIKVAQMRAAVGGAPVYLYEFSYQSEISIKKLVDKVDYKGAGHMEDVTYIFRVNSIIGHQGTFKRTKKDEALKNWMVHFVKNFIRCSDPACKRDRRPSLATPWPLFTKVDKLYQDINTPAYRTLKLDSSQLEIVSFFDSLENRTS